MTQQPRRLAAIPTAASRERVRDRVRFFGCRLGLGCALALFAVAQSGCGGHASSTPSPVVLTVSIADAAYTLIADGSPLLIAVIIVAPTETATFAISGLPAGVSAAYKESESNPSGLLTLVGSSATPPGVFVPRVTIGSSGQSASTTFTLVVQLPSGK